MNQPPTQDRAADCADVVLRLFEFVDNETGPLDRDRIQEHLDECGSCLAEYERDLLIKALVRRACACEEAPPALRSQILTRITTTVTYVEQRQHRG
ncbi:mycothiol system anti-sigma-R factor [Ornithinimicrobium cerasi]|uniref:Mycothiol system anti-sigma-R factor n=1 Tax=Ornithinimicrobium cerasi TaxID=2248773 RepID=A0A285VNW5_9MICO|nr:mycothiol system anti-sigma-R factor [Ornithinimicrobium cerasi]SOC55597.1 mycothiol system anti-sigma-R factor [Ornithinimicrobium cerasi]